jgi:hypothetical protein
MLIEVKEILGKRILILGEMNSGKTRLTAKILDDVLGIVDPKNITVIDMSPNTVPGVGGRISLYSGNVMKVRYLTPEVIRAPRIEGRSKDEVLNFAEFNRMSIEPLIQEFLSKPTRILFINDLSIYLHSGNVSKIVKCLELSHTVVANSYYGESLIDDKGSGISKRERERLEALMNKFSHVLRINNSIQKL